MTNATGTRGTACAFMVIGLLLAGCGRQVVEAQPAATASPAAGARQAGSGQAASGDTASSAQNEASQPKPDAKAAGSRIPIPPIGSTSARLSDVNPEAVLAPTRLRVPAIGIDAAVVPVGADATTGEMAVPPDAATVAWYRHGPTAGERGSAALAAHVDYNGRQGAFFRLRELPLGAPVTVTLEDGSAWSGVVQDVRSYDKRDLPVGKMFARTGQPVLRLITCGGPFDRAARHYRDNIVVSVAADA